MRTFGNTMPTLKPRTTVTLEPATHEVIDRFAVLQGRSRGSVIAEFMDAVVPALRRTVALLDAASSAPDQIKSGLRAVIETAHNDLTAASGQASQRLDQMLFDLDHSESDFELDPHVVTRGSGTPVEHPNPASKKLRNRSKPRDSAA